MKPAWWRMRSGLSGRKQTDEKSERDLAMLGRAGALDRHAQEIAGKNRRALALATDETRGARMRKSKNWAATGILDPARWPKQKREKTRDHGRLWRRDGNRSRAQALRAEVKSWRRQKKSETGASSSQEKLMSEGRKSTFGRQNPEKERGRKGPPIWRHKIEMVKNAHHRWDSKLNFFLRDQ
jgi:hypothetical protein